MGVRSLRPLRGLAVALSVLVAVGPVMGQDSRLQRLDTLGAAQAWQAVGRLDIRGKGFCTGTMIGDDLVLTAAHCLLMDGEPVRAEDVTFRAGFRDGRSYATRELRRFVILPDRQSDPHPGNDLALLELARPVRQAGFRPAQIDGAGLQLGQAVAVVSYAKGRADAPSRQARCTSVEQRGDLMILSCAADFGASGSPVFEEGGTDVLGVILAMGEYQGAPVSVAHRLSDPFQRLLTMAQAGEGIWALGGQGAFTGVTPGQRRDTGAKTVRPPARP